MAVNLVKGQKVDLRKDSGGSLNKVMVGLGWDEAKKSGGLFGSLFGSGNANIDCDASVILCGADGKVAGHNLNDYVVYFANLRHASGAIVHRGDNLTGAGEGDDEQVMVDLQRVPANVDKLVFCVNIYDANKRNQHFGMIRNCFIRVVDTEGNREICRYNLTDDYSGMTGLIVAEIYRRNGGWKFNAIGQGVQDASRLDSLIKLYR